MVETIRRKRYNELDASKTKFDEYVSKLVEAKFMKEFMNLFLLEFDCEKEVFLVYANFFKSQCFLYCVKPVIVDGGRKVLFLVKPTSIVALHAAND